MPSQNKNTWAARIKRTFTSVLPVAKNRTGKCNGCGDCCKLPNVCPFLKFKPNQTSYCAIYPIKPLNCRKYPRTEAEFITKENCDFRFI